MIQAFIVSARRTPIGTFQGSLSTAQAPSLGAAAIRAAVESSGLAPALIDEVIMGEVLTAGVGQAPARQAALRAGLPAAVPAVTVNKVCGSGLKAAMLATQAVRGGDAELVVAGGMESMSRAGWVLPRTAPKVGHVLAVDSMLSDGLISSESGRSMGQIAEQLAQRLPISRAEQDAFAVESHRRAVSAIESGAFDDETVPVTVGKMDATREIRRDDGPRADTTLEALAKLPASFEADGTVTAGNSSMISDGAAAVVIGSQSAVERNSLKPLARIVACTAIGVEPDELFTAPVDAIREVVAKAGLSLDDVDLLELNEAFAVQMLACLRALEFPWEKVNVQGGAIALGHPIGASGARVLVTLVHALSRRKLRFGVAALCLGGGNAVAMLVERVK
jgi:acetyl-CoA C-acetyltransferase